MASEFWGIVFAKKYKFYGVLSDVEMAHPRHPPTEVTPPAGTIFHFISVLHKASPSAKN